MRNSILTIALLAALSASAQTVEMRFGASSTYNATPVHMKINTPSPGTFRIWADVSFGDTSRRNRPIDTRVAYSINGWIPLSDCTVPTCNWLGGTSLDILKGELTAGDLGTNKEIVVWYGKLYEGEVTEAVPLAQFVDFAGLGLVFNLKP